ncbi:MAG: hypothetical protein J3K34DRAFT_519915 [Monoraphidium minutum]|nr:MAG: hypothetical protein J3K34DRAFT_519915 [Monoraphidium minutum]
MRLCTHFARSLGGLIVFRHTYFQPIYTHGSVFPSRREISDTADMLSRLRHRLTTALPQSLPACARAASGNSASSSGRSATTRSRAAGDSGAPAAIQGFWTIEQETSLEVEVKKSRFLATAWPVQSGEEAMRLIQGASDPSASHNCFAWKVGQSYRSSDDGEPGGTAGRPILGAIEGDGLDGVCVLVTRHFGGVKLGAGGLARAYGGAARDCLRAAPKRFAARRVVLRAECAFASLGAVYAAMQRHGGAACGEEVYTEGGGVAVTFALDAGAAAAAAAAVADATSGADGGRAGGTWHAGGGEPPAAWFDGAVGARLRAMLRAMQRDAQAQHRRALSGIAHAHARLLADIGAAKTVDVARIAALVQACADALRRTAEGGAQGLLASSDAFAHRIVGEAASSFARAVEATIEDKDSGHRAKVAALAQSHQEALECQRRAAAAELAAALTLQVRRLEQQREEEVGALWAALARQEAAAAAERERGQLLLENSNNQARLASAREELAVCRREAQGWRARWERGGSAAGGGASWGGGSAAGPAGSSSGGSGAWEGRRLSGTGAACVGGDGGGGAAGGAAGAWELEAARAELVAARAEVARRDAVLVKCRDTIIALEAQLLEARRSESAHSAPKPPGA